MKVTYSRHSDPRVAAFECIQQAREGSFAPRLALIFCGGKHPPAAVLEAIREELGPLPVVGGAAAGAISRSGQRIGFGYSGFELGILFFEDDCLPQYVSSHALQEGELAAGRVLGERVKAMAQENAVVVLFYDSVASTHPLRLHPGAPLVEGFYAGIGSLEVHLVGAGLLTDMNLSDGWLYDGEGIAKHAALALVFPPDVRGKTTIMHGCRPVSTFMEITRVSGPEIFELDGQPALDVLEKMLSLSLGEPAGHELSLLATLGEKHGDPYAPFNENSYVNRLILRTNRQAGSFTIFEPDFRLGTLVQIMARDNTMMLDSVKKGVEHQLEEMQGHKPIMSFYIDCAGRCSARSGAPMEEAEVALAGSQELGALFGFYSGVEVAPVNHRSRPLDWTAVLTTLYKA